MLVAKINPPAKRVIQTSPFTSQEILGEYMIVRCDRIVIGAVASTFNDKIEFEVNGKKGEYARSRSVCFFCFFQQKIEWVWLYEQHPDLYKKAMDCRKMNHEKIQKFLEIKRKLINQAIVFSKIDILETLKYV
jgi:hypothetical protein